MRTRDYLIGAIGILGAFNVFGLLGRPLYILTPFFWFFSIYVVLFSAIALIYRGILKTLTPVQLRRYLFYLFTNSLPTLAFIIFNYLGLKLWG
jgi:hypothetical protein